MNGEETAASPESQEQVDVGEVENPDDDQLPLVPRKRLSSGPSIGTFTIQCAKCLQWRIVPTKERYEEFRERIAEEPFLCVKGKEWNPNLSCNAPPDITRDGSRVWAVDRPNIPRAPEGWERLLRFRYSASSKFADVQYVAPCGTRLRSMVQLQRFLNENPHYKKQGISKAQFSFQIPKPFQEERVRKPSAAASDNGITGSSDATEVNPTPSGSSSKDCAESPESGNTQMPKKRKVSSKNPGKSSNRK